MPLEPTTGCIRYGHHFNPTTHVCNQCLAEDPNHFTEEDLDPSLADRLTDELRADNEFLRERGIGPVAERQPYVGEYVNPASPDANIGTVLDRARQLADWIERDRREPDKVLAYAQELRRIL